MTDSEIIERLQVELGKLKTELVNTQAQLISERSQHEALAKRSGEIERSAMLVAQATELCRQLRGGSMEHLKTAP